MDIEITNTRFLGYANSLTNKFIDEFKTCINNFSSDKHVDIVNFFIETIKLVREYWGGRSDAFENFIAQDRAKLIQYGHTWGYIRQIDLQDYFHLNLLLLKKGILNEKAFEELGNKYLTVSDLEDFLFASKVYLEKELDKLLLVEVGTQNRTDLTVSDKGLLTLKHKGRLIEDAEIVMDEQDKEITKARQLLAIYFLIQGVFNVVGRDSTSVSGIAKMIHLLTGTKYTTLQNSEIYKKYLRMPNVKQGKALLQDLHFIKPYFEASELQDVVTLIDAEIKRAVGELSYNDKKKYKSERELKLLA